MYNVVFTVVEVPKPRSRDGSATHVGGPSKVYKVGDRITVATNPGRLVLSDTDSVCLAAISAVLPLTSAWCRETSEEWDYTDKIKYWCCPDIERPVVFEVERIPVEPSEVPLR